MKPASRSEIFVFFTGSTDGATVMDPAVHAARDEAGAQEWIASRLKERPTLDAESFLVVVGERVPFEIIPPERSHRVIIGATDVKPTKPRTDEYRACVSGEKCMDRSFPDNKPGNAYGRPRGLCAACYEALPPGDPKRVTRTRKAKGATAAGE